jgi:hypothetical protein
MNKPSNAPLISHDSVREMSGSTKAKIAALLFVLSAGGGTIAFGTFKGFNNEPRASHKKGVELTDKDANKKVMCLRELFHDLVTKPLFKNKWQSKNCDPKRMKTLSTAPNQLINIVEERKAIFQKEEIDPITETWFSNKGKMVIKVDEASKAVGISAGKIKK